MRTFDWWILGSKLAATLSDPIIWVIALLALGLMFQRRRSRVSMGCALSALMTLFLSSWQPASTWALLKWESRYAVPEQPVATFHGFIALGGIDNFDDAALRENRRALGFWFRRNL